jgi:hypothetical protein
VSKAALAALGAGAALTRAARSRFSAITGAPQTLIRGQINRDLCGHTVIGIFVQRIDRFTS